MKHLSGGKKVLILLLVLLLAFIWGHSCMPPDASEDESSTVLQLLRFTADYALPPYIPGFSAVTKREVLASVSWEGEEIVLEMELCGNDYIFRFGADETQLAELARADGAAINPEKVGCMVGEMLGLFATGNGTDSGNNALFPWAEYQDL